MRNWLLLLTGQATVVGGWLCVAVVTGKYWILVIVYINSLCDWSTETTHLDKCFCTVSQQRQLVNEAIICCVRNNICMLLDISKDVCSVHMSRTIFHVNWTSQGEENGNLNFPNNLAVFFLLLTWQRGEGGEGREGEGNFFPKPSAISVISPDSACLSPGKARSWTQKVGAYHDSCWKERNCRSLIVPRPLNICPLHSASRLLQLQPFFFYFVLPYFYVLFSKKKLSSCGLEFALALSVTTWNSFHLKHR